MPFYQRMGEVPRKRHTVFRKPGGSIYYEELISRDGFSGQYSNLYHLHMPTRVRQVGPFMPIEPIGGDHSHRPRHLRTAEPKPSEDHASTKRLLFFNEDIMLYKAHPSSAQNYDGQKFFYRNGHFDELIFVQSGHGSLHTQLGDIDFKIGDYLLIPRGVIYRLDFDLDSGQKSLLIIESGAAIQTPKRYRNGFGQLLESAPYSERDFRAPRLRAPCDESGEFCVRVRLRGGTQDFIYDRHPFDVVGWDGCFYPLAFNIHDFDPIVGRIHQPPSVHQTFESSGFIVCSFVSRPFDFHPDAIPAPYPHSNVDSDEILFYSDGEFMSRKGITAESITYHPMGLPHGPQPGKYEASIGKKATNELAVMIDTFKPLHITIDALPLDDPNYALSWID